MVAARFSWVKPDVYPLIAAVSAGVSAGVYLSVRSFLTTPTVEWNRTIRKTEIKGDSQDYCDRATAYKTTGVFRRLSTWWNPHQFAEGELCTLDNHNQPTTQYNH